MHAETTEACPSDDELAAFLRSGVRDDRGEGVLAHLDACASCRAAVAAGAVSSLGARSSAGETQPIEVGSVVGRYVVMQRIGEGGMGVVYAAYDPDLDRKVALKVVRPGVHASAAILAKEARTLARVSHPNVVAAYDVGYWGNQVFLVMEFLSGVNLRVYLGRPDLRATELLAMLVGAGEGLLAAHRAGIAHRDVKPENIVVDAAHGAHVTDFGLARALEPDGSTARELVGTPLYMAPEQLAGQVADARSDQFSFAVVLVEALCGTLPYHRARGREGALPHKELMQGLPWGKRGTLPARVPKAILRALETDPARRYPTLEELLAELRPRRTRGWALALTLGACAIVGATSVAIERKHAADAQVCGGSEERIAKAWNQERSQAAEVAFAALPVPYAKDTWATVRMGIETYVASWTAAYVETCEATRIRKVQPEAVMSQNLACLDERRRGLDALASDFVRPTAKVAEQAVRALGGLASVESCLDPRSSRAHRTFVDAERNRRADALADAIAKASADVSVGAFTGTKESLGSLVDAARSLGDDRLVADALAVRGGVARAEPDLSAAEQSFLESALTAEADRDDDLAARARLSLLDVVGNELADAKRGEACAREAEAAVGRLGKPPHLLARLLVGRGNVAIDEDKLDRAIALGDEALRIDEKDLTLLEVSSVQSLVGRALLYRFRVDEALPHLERSLSTAEAALGPFHPRVARALNSLAEAADKVDDVPKVISYMQRARNILEKNGVTHGTDWLRITGTLAANECRGGDVPHGLRLAREAAAAVDGHPVHADVFNVENQLGMCLARAGQLDEARGAYQRARAALDADPFPYEDARLSLGIAQARLELDTSHADAAIRVLEEVLHACATHPALAPFDVAAAKMLMARALREAHRQPARSRTLAGEARDAYETAAEAHRAQLAELEAFLAHDS